LPLDHPQRETLEALRREFCNYPYGENRRRLLSVLEDTIRGLDPTDLNTLYDLTDEIMALEAAPET
jgi:hypothetical protein